jgi:hypothetical protein
VILRKIKKIKSFIILKEKMYSEDDEGDKTLKKDMFLRQSRVLYPELEEWLLEMTVNMYIVQEKENQKVKKTDMTINDEY